MGEVGEILVVVAGEGAGFAACTGGGVVFGAVGVTLMTLKHLQVLRLTAFTLGTEPIIIQMPLTRPLVTEVAAIPAVPANFLRLGGKLISNFRVSGDLLTLMAVGLLWPPGDVAGDSIVVGDLEEGSRL